MSALSAARTNVSNKGPIKNHFGYKTKATKVFYNGAMVMVGTDGYLIPAATTVGGRGVGIIDLGNLNSKDTTGLSDGDFVADVVSGIFPMFAGTSTDLPTIADLEKPVYFLDDQTISRLPGAGRPVAGILKKIDGTSFYVAMGDGSGNPGAATEASATAWQGIGSTENVAAPGAISVLTHETLLTTIDGTDAFTLADGLFVGQEKIIRSSTTGANTPIGTVTPATPRGFASITAFGVIGDLATLVWTATGWIIRAHQGVTVA